MISKITDVVIVDSADPPAPKSFDEEANEILRRHVGGQMLPRVSRQIEAQLQAASRRWYPDQKVFCLCEFDMITRGASMHIWHPAYLHACEACEFLGRWVGTAELPEREADLYTCMNGPGRTYIARFSDEPADYTSGAAFGGLVVSLREARRRHGLRSS